MTFASPTMLVALLLVPLAGAAYLLATRHRLRFAERFASRAMVPNVIHSAPAWRRHVPVAILLLALTAMLVGVARPRAFVNVKRQNATVVLAVDTSLSMSAVDVRPSRIKAIKLAAHKFLAEIPKRFRVGVVDFSTTAGVVAAATRNRALVQRAIDGLTPGGGTALGDGITSAINVARAVPQEPPSGNRPAAIPPAAVIVFTDGVQEGGEVTAAQAVNRARKLNVPVSAVLVGTQYGIISVATATGGFTQFIRVPSDATEVKQIAKYTGGHFYVGPRTADLSLVYKDLGSRIETVRKREELTFVFAIGAVVLLLAGGALSAVWLRRVP